MIPPSNAETDPDSAGAVEHPEDNPQFPSLKRLHFVTASARSRAALLSPSCWLRASPITHLRISDVTDSDETIEFTSILARALGLPEPAARTADEQNYSALPATSGRVVRSGGTILPHLRRLLIQTEEPNPGLRGDEGEHDPFDALNASLRALAREIEDVEDLSLLMVEKSWKKRNRWRQRLWDDWLGRMSGRKGCWVESAEEEKELEGPDVSHPHIITGFMLYD